MEHDESLDKSLFEMQELKDIKKRPDILSRIRFEVTPQMVMEPRFQANAEDLKKLREMAGYIFYIETQCSPSKLMLMRLGKADIMSTVGCIEEIPQDMIDRAVEKPVHPPSHGMYAITDEIKEWLKKELGL